MIEERKLILKLLFAFHLIGLSTKVNGRSKIFSKPPEDMKLSWDEICTKNGYICSDHYVETIDGFILNLKRISGHISEDELS